MKNSKPLVSIGIPVYNGADCLCRALESLLVQDYENIEFIISDNHSNDSTQEICLDFLTRDKRIRYFRHEMNLGPKNNFNKVFELSQGEYFMWHAYDDYREPSYVSSCLGIMEMNPNVILCCSNSLLNEDGNLRDAEEDFNTGGMSLNRRFRKILWNNTCLSIYGLIRSDALKETKLLQDTAGTDNLLLAELSLLGEFYQLPLFLFHVKTKRKNIFQRIDRILDLHLPDRDQYVYLPFIKLAVEHCKLVHNAQLKKREKFIAFLDIFLCFLLKYKVLLADPLFTLYLSLSKLKKSKFFEVPK
jgi:glycosyltransferase involved in cell wall biosynthesis